MRPYWKGTTIGLQCYDKAIYKQTLAQYPISRLDSTKTHFKQTKIKWKLFSQPWKPFGFPEAWYSVFTSLAIIGLIEADEWN